MLPPAKPQLVIDLRRNGWNVFRACVKQIDAAGCAHFGRNLLTGRSLTNADRAKAAAREALPLKFRELYEIRFEVTE